MFVGWRKNLGWSVRVASVSVVALAVMLLSAPATAAIIITPNYQEGGVESLNEWNYDSPGLSVELYEDWAGVGQVAFFLRGSGSGDPLLGGTDIEFSKNLFNQTDFDWTDFHIDLFPGDGADGITVDIASVSSDRFSDVMVMNNNDGSASIWYFTDKNQGDTPVLIGERVNLFFTMTIFGDINFEMRQTPTPAPGALALFALAGAALRRRRRS